MIGQIEPIWSGNGQGAGRSLRDALVSGAAVPLDDDYPIDAELRGRLTVALFELNLLLALAKARGLSVVVDIVERPNPHRAGTTYQEVIEVGLIIEDSEAA